MTPAEHAWLIIAAVVVAWYLIDCAIWPWLPCPLCGGRGIRGPRGRKVFRDCPHRAARRLRVGARLVRPDLRRK